MVKRAYTLVSLVILSTVITSCCYNGIVSEYGLPRRKIPNYNYQHKRIYEIDTTIVYKLDAVFIFSSSLKKITRYDKEDENTYPYVSYLKYYSNGKVGLFVIEKNKAIVRDDFNTQKAKMGYFSEYEPGKIKQRISTIGDCSLYISERKGYIENDSIVLYDKNDFGHVYKKANIPSEYLKDWKPDW